MNKIMVLKGGSPAIHKLGDIGRKEDDMIRIHSETDTHCIGNFEEGFGFIDVEFKKEDCRNLTKEERVDLEGQWFGVNGNPLYRLYLDEEGNVVPGSCLMKDGTITKVVDSEGNYKRPEFIGMEVKFQPDIQIGKSLVMFTDDSRYITTSKVTNVEIVEGNYIIHTKNSVYYISV